jgi:DNA replication protein DnaC
VRAAKQQALDRLSWYCETMPERLEAGEGLILFGPVGTGKDHLAVCVAREAIRGHGIDVVWTDGTRLFSEIRDGMDLSRTEGSVLEPLERAPVLYLSDPVPPAAELSRFERAVLFRLIDARYRALKPTWITCNFEDAADANSRLSLQVMDRLRHGSVAVDCNWKSARATREPAAGGASSSNGRKRGK